MEMRPFWNSMSFYKQTPIRCRWAAS